MGSKKVDANRESRLGIVISIDQGGAISIVGREELLDKGLANGCFVSKAGPEDWNR